MLWPAFPAERRFITEAPHFVDVLVSPS